MDFFAAEMVELLGCNSPISGAKDCWCLFTIIVYIWKHVGVCIYSLFPPGLAGLLGWSPSSPGGNWFIPENRTFYKFEDFWIDSFISLLDWLNFWAEVHLVQEEIDLSQKGLLQNRTFKIFWIDSLFLLDWLDFWAEVHLVQEEIDLSQKRICNHNFSHFCIFIVSFIPYWTAINIVLFVFLFFLGRYARFSWVFFLLAGTYRGKK